MFSFSVVAFSYFNVCLHSNEFICVHFSSDVPWVHEMRLEFKKPPSMCDKYSKQITPAKMGVRGEYMDVVFDMGFNQKVFVPLLEEMVCWGIDGAKVNAIGY